MIKRSPFKYFETSPEITRLAVMLDGIYQSASFVVDRHNIRKLDKHQELV